MSDGRPLTPQGIDQHGIDRDFPILYEMAQQYDFAERLGGSAPVLEETDRALRELWMARGEKAGEEMRIPPDDPPFVPDLAHVRDRMPERADRHAYLVHALRFFEDVLAYAERLESERPDA